MQGNLVYPIMQSQDIPGLLDPLDLFRKIGFDADESRKLSVYWETNREKVKVHYFPFLSHQSIIGAFLGDDGVALNAKVYLRKEFLLFVLLHEGRHLDQHRDSDFNGIYFEPVINGDLALFLSGYTKTEREANDFALSEMISLGYSSFAGKYERLLRSNELLGEMVFKTVAEDIAKTGAGSFQELIKFQLVEK